MKVIRSEIAGLRSMLPEWKSDAACTGNDMFAIIRLQPSATGEGWRLPAMRPDFHTLCILESGNAMIHAGAASYPLHRSAAVWARPEIYYFADFTSVAEGYLLAFSPSFLREIMPGIGLQAGCNALTFSFCQKGLEEVRDVCRAFYADWQRYPSSRSALSGNLLAGLLLLMLEEGHPSCPGFSPSRLVPDKGQRLLESFLLLLDDHFSRLAAALTDEMWRAADYAGLLHVCPSYLSKNVRQYSGRTIEEWRRHKILDDAIFLLRHTRMPISDISDRFCFRECSYFHAFFRKYTALTPGSYRSRQHVLPIIDQACYGK